MWFQVSKETCLKETGEPKEHSGRFNLRGQHSRLLSGGRLELYASERPQDARGLAKRLYEGEGSIEGSAVYMALLRASIVELLGNDLYL